MRLLTKIWREILVGISKVSLRRTLIRKGGVFYKIPLIYGIGRFHFLDNEPFRKKAIETTFSTQTGSFLDVGVNVGQTLIDLKGTNSDVIYYGFEPNAICVFYVNELARLNNFQNVFVLPFGLGNTSEILTLHSNRVDDASSSIVENGSSKITTAICVRHGDDFVGEQGFENISFIKIDTEGYELMVLEGLKKTIMDNLPIIFCEVMANKSDNKQIFDLISELDYTILERDQSYPMAIKPMDDSKIFINPQHDYIFAPRNKSDDFLKHFNND